MKDDTKHLDDGGGFAPQFPPVKTVSREALTSSASDDWGTPEVVRKLAACVMRPAAKGPTAIDLDASSSKFWNSQWSSEDRPAHFFDGSAPTLDIYKPEAWGADYGSVFENPAGDSSGENVQNAWAILERRHTAKEIDSLFWVGFSLEQLRSLLPKTQPTEDEEGPNDPPDVAHVLHPLHPSVCTVFPSKRIAYLVRKEAAIVIQEKRRIKMTKPKEIEACERKISALRAALILADDTPVPGSAPTHSSYLSILWSHDRNVRRRQQTQLRKFITGQSTNPKSPLVNAVCIGDVG